jgi:3'-5' exoribonuclease
MPILRLSDLTNGQEGDFFALLAAKEEQRTRDGKPYFRVTFRDAAREVAFPIWSDSPWAQDCRDQWTPGTFYKLRATYRETNYGPQLEIRRIRAVVEADAAEGFDPAMCRPRSRFDPATMFEELSALVRERVADAALRELTLGVLQANRERLLTLPAATRNHHTYLGGWLEHVLSVSRTADYFAQKYAELYPDLQPPLDRSLVVAGAVLHDIGKLREYEEIPSGAAYTASGHLVGHIVQGRDIVREAAAGRAIDHETQLRLEHLILAHQRLPEWGSPKPPMTPEALLVHYADDVDAKFQMMAQVLAEATGDEPVTSPRNPLGQRVYRGPTASHGTGS